MTSVQNKMRWFHINALALILGIAMSSQSTVAQTQTQAKESPAVEEDATIESSPAGKGYLWRDCVISAIEVHPFETFVFARECETLGEADVKRFSIPLGSSVLGKNYYVKDAAQNAFLHEKRVNILAERKRQDAEVLSILMKR